MLIPLYRGGSRRGEGVGVGGGGGEAGRGPRVPNFIKRGKHIAHTPANRPRFRS